MHKIKSRRIEELEKEVLALKVNKGTENDLQIVLNLQKQVDEYERAFGDLLLLLYFKRKHSCMGFKDSTIKEVFKAVYKLKEKVFPDTNEEGETGLL